MLTLSAPDTCSTRDSKVNAIGHQIEHDQPAEGAGVDKMICMQIGGAEMTHLIL
jgi:hypothetical protein